MFLQGVLVLLIIITICLKLRPPGVSDETPEIGKPFWHLLLDRPASRLELSAYHKEKNSQGDFCKSLKWSCTKCISLSTFAFNNKGFYWLSLLDSCYFLWLCTSRLNKSHVNTKFKPVKGHGHMCKQCISSHLSMTFSFLVSAMLMIICIGLVWYSILAHYILT